MRFQSTMTSIDYNYNHYVAAFIFCDAVCLFHYNIFSVNLSPKCPKLSTGQIFKRQLLLIVTSEEPQLEHITESRCILL